MTDIIQNRKSIEQPLGFGLKKIEKVFCINRIGLGVAHYE